VHMAYDDAPETYSYRKQHQGLYVAHEDRIRMVTPPPMNFLMIDGAGDPAHASEYRESLTALYRAAFSIQYAFHRVHPSKRYSLPPLEGLWWHDDEALLPFETLSHMKELWCWTMMIPLPEPVERELAEAELRLLQNIEATPLIHGVRIEAFDEGPCAQLLHVGPYSEMGSALHTLHDAIRAHGALPHGRHHEIYLVDARHARPEVLRTILRQPVVTRR
jgi:hypothetical protein